MQLHDEVVKAEDVTDEQKARICERVAEADKVGFPSSFVVYFRSFCSPFSFNSSSCGPVSR